jgi:hypothetical protein
MSADATPPPFDPARHRAAMECALDLTIAPEHAVGVERNLALVADLAALITSFPLDETIEAAPVFRA